MQIAEHMKCTNVTPSEIRLQVLATVLKSRHIFAFSPFLALLKIRPRQGKLKRGGSPSGGAREAHGLIFSVVTPTTLS